jgi:hypothetical protein
MYAVRGRPSVGNQTSPHPRAYSAEVFFSGSSFASSFRK